MLLSPSLRSGDKLRIRRNKTLSHSYRNILLKDRHFRKENSFFRFENCRKFSGNFRKFNALGPSIPLEEYAYKFSVGLLKNSSKMRLPQKNYFTQKVSLPKKVLHQKWVLPENCVFIKKSVSPEKMFHLKNSTNAKKFLRECNIYVKIPNFLTSENFGKFLR